MKHLSQYIKGGKKINKILFIKNCFILFLIISLLPSANGNLLTQPKIRLTKIQYDSVYPLTPDWISGNPHYSTGCALADFNLDGWLDLIVADGNDKQTGHVNLYYNDGEGHLPTIASWQSSDFAYNGHLDVADINGDGWPDVAVSYLGTGSSKGPIARVYLNNNGELSFLPDWESDIIGNAFGVDFGDMNNDGRPDLAVATGWAYDQYYYPTYVYLNVDGELESEPSWASDDSHIYMGALWVDADDDGWLDLACISYLEETHIYQNQGGILDTTPSWQTTDSWNQFGNTLAVGDVNGDDLRDLFASDNTQLGGSGLFKQYDGLDDGLFKTTYSWNYYDNAVSAIALADVNYDGKLDLATGGWWEYTRLFINDGTGLPDNPSWSSTGATSDIYDNVVEKIVFGNVGPDFCEQTFKKNFSADGNRQLFYLPHQEIQKICNVSLDGDTLAPSDYTYSREDGWITVNTAPLQYLEVVYTYSSSIDMVVTNWDPFTGNYLFYNQLQCYEPIPDLDCEGSLGWTNIKPGATVEGSFMVSNIGDPNSLLNWEISSFPSWGTWMFTPESGNDLLAGDSVIVYVQVIAPNEKDKKFEGEIRVENSENPEDFCIIPTTLKTPKNHSKLQSLNFRSHIVYKNVINTIRHLLKFR